ncbi:hypothetical protein FHT09_000853 [Xanthomonas arboricola]|nr:hypothetical protein [Xanthomonas sp. CFBP 8152]
MPARDGALSVTPRRARARSYRGMGSVRQAPASDSDEEPGCKPGFFHSDRRTADAAQHAETLDPQGLAAALSSPLENTVWQSTRICSPLLRQ